jgi:phosphate-selective porin OprO/OprP
MGRYGKRVVLAAVLAVVGVAPAWGGGSSVEDRLRQLEYRLEEQERKLESQMEQIKAQKEQIRAQREEIAKVEETKAPAPADFKAFWKDGPRLETTDGNFKLKIGGRIHNDYYAIAADDDVEAAVGNVPTSGTEFRRARLYLEGTIYKNILFKMQYDFAGGDADFKDVYVGMEKLPFVGRVQVGQFKEPFSLEELTSSNYNTFLERGLPNAMAPSRSTGMMLTNAVLDERMTWAGGVFRDSDDFGNSSGDGGYNFTGRLTGLPWRQDETHLLHLGTAYSWRNTNDGEVRFRARPEIHDGPRYVDTDAIAADDYQQLGVEAALVYGPASLQGEYISSWVNADASDNPQFGGWYVQGSYFLTPGDARVYKTSAGAFDKVKPAHPFLWGDEPGLGAWELAVRYSQLDLDDGGFRGGKLDDVSAGLNWYLNTNVRVMLNYIYADLDDIGDTHAAAMRFQIYL